MDTEKGRSPQDHDLPEERPAKRRSRSAVACQRCKSRKQRCDNEFPSCSNCLAAGEPCAYGVKQIYPAEYVRSLENHIAQLERSLTSADPKAVTDHLERVGKRPRDCPQEVVDSPGDLVAEGLEPSLHMGVGFVALSPNSYLGISSGFQLAKLVKSAIPQTKMLQGEAKTASRPPSGLHSSMRHHDPNSSVCRADMPSDEISEELLGAYISKVHPKHPFLSRTRISILNKDRNALTQAHLSRSPGVRPHRLDNAILHLVFAIGARYLQLANDYNHPSPEAHYAAALADVDAIFDVRSLENLEAMLLLSIYQLRSQTGPGIWWMIGTTMRHCLDCGLHRKSAASSLLHDQRRKRIFWTAYMLERSVARTVGRPYAVTDREIDVALPANISDSLETDEEIEVAIAEAISNPAQITPLTAAIHIIRVQQIESKISYTICRVDKPINSIKPHKIAKLRDALEDWKMSIPLTEEGEIQEGHPYSTTDYHMVQYHKALVLLYLPLLPSLAPSHPDFRHVAYSAGQICQLYKRLHDNQSYISFSLLALHANFVAGLVLVYCFCLDPTLFNTSFSSDIRACSTMLYTISERWAAARKVRNAFESLVAVTIEGQHDASSQGPCYPRDKGRFNSGLMPLELNSLQSQRDDRTPRARNNDQVWDNFETVLGDYQLNADTWMQDGIFQAMDAFPAEAWGSLEEPW